MQKSKTVLAALRDLLATDALAIGEKLPSERELAGRFSCSRETLRGALSTLERERVVWRHVGQGTFKGPRPGTAPLRDNLVVEAASVQELVQARILIEPVVAAEAAKRATAAHIEKLNDCVAKGRAAPDRLACQRADDVFHRTIAEAAMNPILSSFLTFLSDARRRSTWQAQWDRTYRHIGMEEFTGQHSDQHQRIVDAIKARSSRAAETEMRAHLVTIRRALQLAPGSPKFADLD